MAKLLVHRKTRREAISTMRRALGEFIVSGIKTNIALHERIFGHGKFVRGDFDTGFIENVRGREWEPNGGGAREGWGGEGVAGGTAGRARGAEG